MTVNINASTNSKRIPIGRCEDNEATRVVFDCSGFSSAYGSGQATLLHKRSKEKISYIVQNVSQTGNTVTWTVSSDDTAFSGEGTLQLMWTVNDVVVHSHFYTTITDPSLTDSSTEPTEVKSALQLLIDSCYTKEETDDLIAHVRAGADWNADEGEDGYIENRPFYEAVDKVKICDGAVGTSNEYIQVNGQQYSYRLIEGSNYLVEYNGHEYTCVASIHPDAKLVYIGSGKGIGESSHERPEYPFNIYNIEYSDSLIGCVDNSEVNQFSLYSYNEYIRKLDPKFINGKFITSGTGENSEVYNDISNNVASGNYSHAEGSYTTASGFGSHSEGSGSKYAKKYTGTNENKLPGAVGAHSHVECLEGRAEGYGSHVEGNSCFAGSHYGHAEGEFTSSIGRSSHSEGYQTVSNGDYSHSEGQQCVTSSGAICGHAEGLGSEARGQYSHSEGCYTVATSAASHAGGKYNIVDNDMLYAEIIGNGTSTSNRSNARTLDWNGNEKIKGSLTLGMNTADENTITPAQLAKLLYPFRENHWESPRFFLPSGYVTPGSSSILTEQDVTGSSSTDIYAVYYLPRELDLDAISSLEVISYSTIYNATSQTIVRYLTHRTETSFGTMQVLWSPNCKAMGMNEFAIVKASDFVTNGSSQPYDFPDSVKTIAVLLLGTKPNQSRQIMNRIEALSLDWTLK